MTLMACDCAGICMLTLWRTLWRIIIQTVNIGLYLRSAVMVQPTLQDSEPVLAYVYHQSQPDQASAGGAGAGADSAGDGGVIDFPGGDWLASRDDGQDPSAGASASASEEAKTTIFSYGSNGISQLRARVRTVETGSPLFVAGACGCNVLDRYQG